MAETEVPLAVLPITGPKEGVWAFQGAQAKLRRGMWQFQPLGGWQISPRGTFLALLPVFHLC